MKANYNKLLKLLIDKDMTKTELREKAKISSSTLAKIGKNEMLSPDVLMKICDVLNCDISDILELVRDENEEYEVVKEAEEEVKTKEELVKPVKKVTKKTPKEDKKTGVFGGLKDLIATLSDDEKEEVSALLAEKKTNTKTKKAKANSFYSYGRKDGNVGKIEHKGHIKKIDGHDYGIYKAEDKLFKVFDIKSGCLVCSVSKLKDTETKLAEMKTDLDNLFKSEKYANTCKEFKKMPVLA